MSTIDSLRIGPESTGRHFLVGAGNGRSRWCSFNHASPHTARKGRAFMDNCAGSARVVRLLRYTKALVTHEKALITAERMLVNYNDRIRS